MATLSNQAFEGLTVFKRGEVVYAVTDSKNDSNVRAMSRREFLARFPNSMGNEAKERAMKALRYVYLNHRNQSIPKSIEAKDLGIRITVQTMRPNESKDLVGGIFNVGIMGRKIYEVCVSE